MGGGGAPAVSWLKAGDKETVQVHSGSGGRTCNLRRLGKCGKIPLCCSSECARRHALLMVTSLASIVDNYATTNWGFNFLVMHWKSFYAGKEI